MNQQALSAAAMRSRHYTAFAMALEFLTSLPVRAFSAAQGDELDKSAWGLSLLYYPLVGLVLGGLLAGVAALGQALFTPLLLAAIIVFLWVLLTGALHIDGLADSADAWVGGFGSRERTLTLMKDPTCGPVAVAVVVMTLLLKVAVVTELLLPGSGSSGAFSSGSIAWLLLVPMIGRVTVLALFLTTPYVREAGLGEILVSYLDRKSALAVCVLSLVLVLTLGIGAGLIVLGVAGLVFAALRYLMLRRLGGCTGDTVGALVELIELVVLVTMAAL